MLYYYFRKALLQKIYVLSKDICVYTINVLLLGCCIRFSCTFIKWWSQLDKITIPLLPPPLPSYWMNELTNKLVLFWQPNKFKTNFPLSMFPCIFYIHIRHFLSLLLSPKFYISLMGFIIIFRIWRDRTMTEKCCKTPMYVK